MLLQPDDNASLSQQIFGSDLRVGIGTEFCTGDCPISFLPCSIPNLRLHGPNLSKSDKVHENQMLHGLSSALFMCWVPPCSTMFRLYSATDSQRNGALLQFKARLLRRQRENKHLIVETRSGYAPWYGSWNTAISCSISVLLRNSNTLHYLATFDCSDYLETPTGRELHSNGSCWCFW